MSLARFGSRMMKYPVGRFLSTNNLITEYENTLKNYKLYKDALNVYNKKVISTNNLKNNKNTSFYNLAKECGYKGDKVQMLSLFIIGAQREKEVDCMVALGKYYKYSEYNESKNCGEYDYNEKEAIKYFSMAIDNGSIEAMNELATLYTVKGFRKDGEEFYKKAIELFEMIIKKDPKNKTALNELAYTYNKTKYIEMLVNIGDTYAMENLANIYKIKRDYQKMKEMYNLAIKNGSINSYYSLGYYYMKIEKDETLSNYYFTKYFMHKRL